MASSEVYQPKFNFKTRGHTFICYDYKSPQQLFSSWRSSSSYWLSSCPPLLQSSDFDFIKYSKQKSCLIHAAKNVWGHIISRGDPPLLHLISPLISVYLGNIKMDLNITSFLHRSSFVVIQSEALAFSLVIVLYYHNLYNRVLVCKFFCKHW